MFTLVFSAIGWEILTLLLSFCTLFPALWFWSFTLLELLTFWGTFRTSFLVPCLHDSATGNRWHLIRPYSLTPGFAIYKRGVFPIPATIPFLSNPFSVCYLNIWFGCNTERGRAVLSGTSSAFGFCTTTLERRKDTRFQGTCCWLWVEECLFLAKTIFQLEI